MEFVHFCTQSIRCLVQKNAIWSTALIPNFKTMHYFFFSLNNFGFQLIANKPKLVFSTHLFNATKYVTLPPTKCV